MSEDKRLPFWSDDFDMDLLKVIPRTEEILGDTANVELVTRGHATFDRLNHPSVWNDYRGMIAFFGFADLPRPYKYDGYHTDEPEVRCTFLEAVRDAWPHSYLMLVEFQPIWDTNRTREVFDRIMYHIRGWHVRDEAYVQKLVSVVEGQLELACRRLMTAREMMLLGQDPKPKEPVLVDDDQIPF